ncbi:hypothetical protein M405DRAFT_141410 [Rhizopogon salebrosus TDB-379]|nr:hypothetical protein M405DRAFT_141410 [Rhizopogon salebrosus TDB-379]
MTDTTNTRYQRAYVKIPTTVIHSTCVIQFFPFWITDPALLLQSDAARRFVAVPRNAVSSSVAPRLLRPSPTTYPLQPTFLHHIRKFLRSSFCKNAASFVRNDRLHDPLDVPATSRLSPDDSMHVTTQVHLGMNADDISQPPAAPPITPTPAAASANVKSSLRLLSNWWPIHASHAPPPIVDVPLAQGKRAQRCSRCS